MDRREFLKGATAFTAAALLAGCSGGGGEAEAPQARQTLEVPTTSELAPTTSTTADTTPPMTAAPVETPGWLKGLASPYFGLAMGDRFFELAGYPDRIRERMARCALYGNVIRIDFDGTDSDWKLHDEILKSATQHDLGVIAMIGYVETGRIGSYAGEVIKRYGAQNGGPVRWAELGNEPNVEGFWKNPNAADYAQFFMNGAHAVRAIDPNIKIITAGEAPAVDHYSSEDGPQIAPVTFMGRMLQVMGSEAEELIDGIGYHPYDFPSTTHTEEWSAWDQIAGRPNRSDGEVETLVQVLADHRLSVPLYLTEFGAPTAGGDNSVSPEQQKNLINSFLHYVFPGVATEMRLVHTLLDRPDDPDDIENFFGMVDVNGRDKPAGELLKSAIAAAR